MNQRQSLQSSLFRNLALGPVLLGTILYAMFWFTSHQIKSTIAAELTGRAIGQMDTALAAFMSPVNELMDLGHELGRGGRFERAATEELDTTLSAMLHSVTQIHAVHVARADGHQYMLLKQERGAYYNRVTDPAEPGWATVRRWTGMPGGEATPATERVKTSYDTRTRGWFKRSLAELEAGRDSGDVRGRILWSDPVTFFTTGQHGMTASIGYVTPSGKREVLAFDILLTDILAFAQRTQLRTSGIVFVLLRSRTVNDTVVIAIPPAAVSGVAPGARMPFPVPLGQLAAAPRALVQAAFAGGVPREGRPISFEADGRTWWGAAARSSLSQDRELWVAATVPEDEVLAGIPDYSLITLVAVLLTILAMVVRARWLARRYGNPIGELVTQTERIGRLNFTRETSIESPIREIQVLATTQDAMRRSLAALTEMNDREAFARELRALPQAMRRLRAGRWVVVLHDEPADTVAGCLPALLAATRPAHDGWTIAPDGQADGAVLLVALTQLRGVRAAQQATAWRGVAQALLRSTIAPQALLDRLLHEVAMTGQTTAPVALFGAFVDGAHDRLQILSAGGSRVLAWQGASVRWLHEQAVPSGGGWRSLEMAIDGADRIVVVPESFFDLLDTGRNRLQPAQFEAWFAQCARGTPEDIAAALARAIHDYTGREQLDADLTFCVIGAADAST